MGQQRERGATLLAAEDYDYLRIIAGPFAKVRKAAGPVNGLRLF